MLPSFPNGTLVEMQVGFPYDDLKAGDSVIYYTNGLFVHHRLIVKQAGSWIVKGDNPNTNPVVDKEWVTRENYVGRTTGRFTSALFAPAPVK